MTRLKFLIFLILSLVACSHGPLDTKFDGQWQLCEPPPNENQRLMCLDETDLIKLRTLLIKCGAGEE